MGGSSIKSMSIPTVPAVCFVLPAAAGTPKPHSASSGQMDISCCIWGVLAWTATGWAVLGGGTLVGTYERMPVVTGRAGGLRLDSPKFEGLRLDICQDEPNIPGPSRRKEATPCFFTYSRDPFQNP